MKAHLVAYFDRRMKVAVPLKRTRALLTAVSRVFHVEVERVVAGPCLCHDAFDPTRLANLFEDGPTRWNGQEGGNKEKDDAPCGPPYGDFHVVAQRFHGFARNVL